MKAVKETIRKYYKYQYQDWTQPVLTTNGVIGQDHFAVLDKYGSGTAYRAFDGSTTSAWSSSATNATDYLVFYNPKPLLISNIECFNYTWITGQWELYGSNDNVSYELLASGTNTLTSGSFNIDLSSNTKAFQYYRMDSLSIVGIYQRVGWGELEITAKVQEVIEGTESDYDFYEDIDVYKLPREIDIKYFKTVFEQTTAGEYEVTLDEGNYLVELVGAGGGASMSRASTDHWYMGGLCGGSGAYFKGIVHLSGTISVTVGGAGESAVSGWNAYATGTNGGDTILGNIIISGGGAGADYSRYAGIRQWGVGGTVQILDKTCIVSTSIIQTGLTGQFKDVGVSTVFPVLDKTLSVYDYTTTGYGAGAGTTSDGELTADKVATDGYIKIMQQTTADDSATNETIYTYFTIVN